MKSSFLSFVVACILCVASVVGYGFWYSFIGAKSTAVADLENQITTKTETENRIAAARASLAEIAGDEASIQSYFVPETGVVSFIDNLQTLGRAQGATVSVTSVAKSSTGSRPTLLFSLTVNGTFDQVMRTIGAIEYAPYDLSISALTLIKSGTQSATTKDDKSAKSLWNATLTLPVGSVSPSVATSTP